MRGIFSFLVLIMFLSCGFEKITKEQLVGVYKYTEGAFVDSLILKSDMSYVRVISEDRKIYSEVLSHSGTWSLKNEWLTINDFFVRSGYLKSLKKEDLKSFKTNLIDCIIPVEETFFGCINFEVSKRNKYTKCN